MEESLQLIGMLFDKSLFFLFYDVDSPNLNEFFLLFLLSFSLLCLPILVQFNLPQSLDLSFMLLFLHSSFLPRQELKSLLFSQSL